MNRDPSHSPTDPFEGASVIASTTGTDSALGSGGPIHHAAPGTADGAPSALAATNSASPARSGGSNAMKKTPIVTSSAAAVPGIPRKPAKARSIAWSDRGRKKAADMAAKYTFYRETTPPPAPERSLNAPIVYAQLNANQPPGYGYDHVAPPAPIPVPTVCGVRRRTFWLIMAAVLVLLALALGIGLGVGLGGSDSSTSADEESEQDSNGPQATSLTTSITTGSTPTTTETVTVTTTSEDAESTSMEVTTVSTSNPAITTLVSCPAANNTVFRVPNTSTTFLRLCGIDYSGSGNAVDIGQAWTPTMEDCVIICAGYDGCEACSWGVIEGDPGSYHRCWLKKNLRRSREMRIGWDFAIMQEMDDR